jgi:hypothetical protein
MSRPTSPIPMSNVAYVMQREAPCHYSASEKSASSAEGSPRCILSSSSMIDSTVGNWFTLTWTGAVPLFASPAASQSLSRSSVEPGMRIAPTPSINQHLFDYQILVFGSSASRKRHLGERLGSASPMPV